MSSKSTLFSKIFISLIFLSFIITIYFLFFYKKSDYYFPNLPGGTYIGKISGISANLSEDYPLYIEKIDGANNLLIVIFSPQWKPFVIPLKSNSLLGSNAFVDSFAAINLSNKDIAYLLYATDIKNNQYSGEILSSLGEKGYWQLQFVALEQLKTAHNDWDLRTWLNTKIKHENLSNEMNSLLNNLNEQEQKYQKLSHFVEDSQILKERSQFKKNTLANELNKVTEERKQLTQQTIQVNNDLNLLRFLNKRGQSIEIARRIAKKENDWFNLNWSEIVNPALLESQLAEQDNIDLEKLNADYKKAQEIAELNRNIKEEEDKIAELENKINNPEAPNEVEMQESPAELKPTEEDKPKTKKNDSWWNILE